MPRSIPWCYVCAMEQAQLFAIGVALAALAGVLAALGPARSAAKVDVLKAVVTD